MSSDSARRYLQQAQLFGIRLGLENISAVLEDFGQPHQNYPCLHVAGTNGKGSVCAFLEKIFRLHGLNTGLYTSPHLTDVRERIKVNGQMIPEKDLYSLLGEIQRKEKKLKKAGLVSGALTYFEILTIAAFLYFREKKIDLAVLEVGMGGRFDATNVVQPEVSIITTISYDHQQYLGKTLEKIAFEKAGIIKEKRPCVSGVRNLKAQRVIKKKCREVDAPLVEVFGSGKKLACNDNQTGLVFRYESGRQVYEFQPSLPGFHQGENAAVAIAVAEVMKGMGWKIDKQKIIKGIETTDWPGRLEVFSRLPLIILDGCHNEAGARAVSQYWRASLKEPCILVFAVMKDKDLEKIARWLFPLAARVILTRPCLERAAKPEEIASRLKKYQNKYFLEDKVSSALRLALALSEGRIPILVAGSLFLVGEAREFLSGYDQPG